MKQKTKKTPRQYMADESPLKDKTATYSVVIFCLNGGSVVLGVISWDTL
jgi:hypothetical protein